MNNTRYKLDPGEQFQTSYYVPESFWESRLPQALYWGDYVTEEDKLKHYVARLIKDDVYFTIFVVSRKELLDYMTYHNIAVDEKTEFVWNNGQVYYR